MPSVKTDVPGQVVQAGSHRGVAQGLLCVSHRNAHTSMTDCSLFLSSSLLSNIPNTRINPWCQQVCLTVGLRSESLSQRHAIMPSSLDILAAAAETAASAKAPPGALSPTLVSPPAHVEDSLSDLPDQTTSPASSRPSLFDTSDGGHFHNWVDYSTRKHNNKIATSHSAAHPVHKSNRYLVKGTMVYFNQTEQEMYIRPERGNLDFRVHQAEEHIRFGSELVKVIDVMAAEHTVTMVLEVRYDGGEVKMTRFCLTEFKDNVNRDALAEVGSRAYRSKSDRKKGEEDGVADEGMEDGEMDLDLNSIASTEGDLDTEVEPKAPRERRPRNEDDGRIIGRRLFGDGRCACPSYLLGHHDSCIMIRHRELDWNSRP